MINDYVDDKRLNQIENKLFFLTDSEKVRISIESGSLALAFFGTVVIDSRGMKSHPFGGKIICPPGHYGYISLSERSINLVEKDINGNDVSPYYDVKCDYMSVYRNFHEGCQIRLAIGPIGAMSVVDKNDILCINYNGERYINPALIDFISGNLSIDGFLVGGSQASGSGGVELKNSVFLWGREFNGTNDVTGPMKSVTYVDLTNTGNNVMTPNDLTKNDNRVWYGLGMEVSTNSSFVTLAGTEGLDLYTGTDSSAYINIYSGKDKEPGRLRIGESVLTYDSSTKKLKLYGAEEKQTALYITDPSVTSTINGSLYVKNKFKVDGSTFLSNTSVGELSASGVVKFVNGLTVENGVTISSSDFKVESGTTRLQNTYVSSLYFNNGIPLSGVSAGSGKLSFIINGTTYNVSTC